RRRALPARRRCERPGRPYALRRRRSGADGRTASLEGQAGPPARAPAAAGSGGGPAPPRGARPSSAASIRADRRVAARSAAADAPRSGADADRTDPDAARSARHRSGAGAVAGAAGESATGVDAVVSRALGSRSARVIEGKSSDQPQSTQSFLGFSAFRAERDDRWDAELFQGEP